jgi:type II secretion system protein I
MRLNNRTQQQGFNLIEVLVAMALIAVVSNSMVASFATQSRFNSNAEERTRASQVAQVVLDDLRSDDVTLMPTTGLQTRSVVLAGKSYSVRIDYCSSSEHCTSNTIRHLRVRVSRSGVSLYDVQTVYTQL